MSTNEDTLIGHDRVVVREARPAEHELVTELVMRAFREYWPLLTPAFIARFEAEVGAGAAGGRPGTVLVAGLDRGQGQPLPGGLVGTVTLLLDGSGYDMHGWPRAVPVIRLLATDPSARGRGTGRRLAEECLRRARLAGAPEIGLHTAPFMTAARALYESLGFVRAPELDVEAPGSPPALASLLSL